MTPFYVFTGFAICIVIFTITLLIYDELQQRKEDFVITVQDPGNGWIWIEYRLNKSLRNIPTIKVYHEGTNRLHTRYFNTIREANEFASRFKTREDLIEYVQLQEHNIIKPYSFQHKGK